MRISCPHCDHEFDPDEVSPENTFKPRHLVSLYNEYAVKHKWQKVAKTSDALSKKLSKALKDLPSKEEWDVVFRGLVADGFFSGRNSDYKTNINTLIFKSRYMDFYNAGLEAQAIPSVDDFLAGLK